MLRALELNPWFEVLGNKRLGPLKKIDRVGLQLIPCTDARTASDIIRAARQGNDYWGVDESLVWG